MRYLPIWVGEGHLPTCQGGGGRLKKEITWIKIPHTQISLILKKFHTSQALQLSGPRPYIMSVQKCRIFLVNKDLFVMAPQT